MLRDFTDKDWDIWRDMETGTDCVTPMIVDGVKGFEWDGEPGVVLVDDNGIEIYFFADDGHIGWCYGKVMPFDDAVTFVKFMLLFLAKDDMPLTWLESMGFYKMDVA